jgi:hypothetical protein
MAFANNTLEDLDKKICNTVGVDYNDYKNMTIHEQSKVREQYMTKRGYKHKKHK